MKNVLISKKAIQRLTLTGITFLAIGVQLAPKASASYDYVIESSHGCYYGSYSTYVAGNC